MTLRAVPDASLEEHANERQATQRSLLTSDLLLRDHAGREDLEAEVVGLGLVSAIFFVFSSGSLTRPGSRGLLLNAGSACDPETALQEAAAPL